MKKFALTFIGLATLFGSVSCNTYGPNTKMGAAFGGLAGAGLGAIVGHQSGRALEGMGIGAAAGAVTGALMGSSADDRYGYPPPPPPRRYNPNYDYRYQQGYGYGYGY